MCMQSMERDGSDWLESTGFENISNVNRALAAASPWELKFEDQISGDLS